MPIEEAEFTLSDRPDLTPAERQSILSQLELLRLKGKATNLKMQAACDRTDRRLLKLQAERLSLVQKLDAKIAELEAERLSLSAPFLNELADLESRISGLVKTLGESYSSPDLVVDFKSHGISITYDYKLLDILRDTNPEIWSLIAPARREKPKEPTIKIAWK